MTHRLLCCSDTHGEMPPSLDEAGAVGWLHAGDICNGPDIVESDTDPTDDLLLAPVARWVEERRDRLWIVPGNHDVADVYHAFQGDAPISGRIIRLAENLCVAGIGWHGEKYYDLPLERDLTPACESVLRQARRLLSRRDHLILLTHYPPRFPGTRDVPNDRDGCGVWYDCVRHLVEELKPVAIVQGHNHRWFGTSHRVALSNREILILNPGPTGCILEIDSASGEARAS